ncbi:uncharacterized protein F5Z01DRAFT_123927 [Emericellopsis atlantica]|uniref:Uncharacterized protein n=1 Tax=Emericellopsis atlantica TaxID=2614577 RepID=A0A9P7ZKB0_9HYPO|nr:uncharacterized protein F5Z01DRAFT_123927 [Emericellopsis atlantica]KAG9253703.1 hypothetical protein F5Z01DRAFT_123927 [Emericellopsis atlantica]
MPHEYISSRRYSSGFVDTDPRRRSRRSRAFDCCLPLAPRAKPKYEERDYDYLPTHGVYVMKDPRSRDPEDCQCTCCPHSYAGARRASQDETTSRNDSGRNTYDTRYRSYVPSKRQSWKKSSRDEDTLYSPAEPEYATDKHDRLAEPRWATSSTSIAVVNDTYGSVRRRHGSYWRLGLSPNQTVRQILADLISDPKRYKVIVHWDDGQKETLTERIPMSELREFGHYLEVVLREQKRVRFAPLPSRRHG